MGRPKDEATLYEKYIMGKEDLIIANCRAGATNETLAKSLGIGLTTFKRILKDYPVKMKELLKEGKQEADFKVESELFRRAIGYDYEETETIVSVDKDGSATPTKVRKIKRHVPGDVAAQIYWLKNRKPDTWKDRNIVAVEGDKDNPVVISWPEVLKETEKVSEEELFE
jgi:hypothetical protein